MVGSNGLIGNYFLYASCILQQRLNSYERAIEKARDIVLRYVDNL